MEFLSFPEFLPLEGYGFGGWRMWVDNEVQTLEIVQFVRQMKNIQPVLGGEVYLVVIKSDPVSDFGRNTEVIP